MALLLAGEGQIEDYDNTEKPAMTAKAFFDLCLSSLTSRHDWSWSIKLVILSPDTIVPDFGYSARFLLPDDYNHYVQNIIEDPEEESIDFRVFGEYLHYSADIIELKYSCNIQNVIIMSAMAAEALTYLLASKLAAALSSSPEKPNTYLEGLYERRLAAAIVQDPSEMGIGYVDNRWETIR